MHHRAPAISPEPGKASRLAVLPLDRNFYSKREVPASRDRQADAANAASSYDNNAIVGGVVAHRSGPVASLPVRAAQAIQFHLLS
jgi:hypothetical protein